MRRVSASAGKLNARAVAGDCCGAELMSGARTANAAMVATMVGRTIDLELIILRRDKRMGFGLKTMKWLP